MYPSDLIDPLQKGKQYCLDYIKEMEVQLSKSERRMSMVLHKQYANALQPTDLYKDFYNPKKDGIRNDTYLNTNFKNLPILVKYKNIVLNYLAKRDYDVYMDAINPLSIQTKADEELKTWVKMQLQPIINQISAEAGIPQDTEQLPETREELQLNMLFNFRLPYEVQMELGVEMVKNKSDWNDIMKRLREDMFATGFLCTSIEIDTISKQPRIEYCPIEDMIFEEFTGFDGSKSIRIGQYRYITIADLMLEAGEQFTEEEILEIASKVTNRHGNPLEFNRFNNEHHSFKIQILDCQWFSVDTIKTMSGYSYGNFFRREVDFKTPVGKKTWEDNGVLIEREVKATAIKTVYGGKWICGTNYIYDYGKARNILRKQDNPKECSLKFKLYKAAETSPAASVTEFVDAIQMSWIKLRNVLAKAAPNGWDVDLSALEDMVLDGKKISVSDTLKMKIETGIGLYRRKALLEDDVYNNSPEPIKYSQGGVGSLAMDLINDINQNIEFIRQVLGVNEAMDASTPQASQLVGVQQIALAGSQNAIDHLLDAQSKVNELVAIDIARAIQLVVRVSKESIVDYVLTENGKKIIEIGNEVNQINGENIIYSCRIEAKPSQDQIVSIKEKLNMALANSQNPEAGGIEISDAIEIERMINSGVNLKLVSLCLQNRITKAKENARKLAEQRSMVEHENRMKEIEAAKQSQAEQEARKMEAEKALYSYKTDEDIRKMEAEVLAKSKLDALNSEFKKSEQLLTQ